MQDEASAPAPTRLCFNCHEEMQQLADTVEPLSGGAAFVMTAVRGGKSKMPQRRTEGAGLRKMLRFACVKCTVTTEVPAPA